MPIDTRSLETQDPVFEPIQSPYQCDNCLKVFPALLQLYLHNLNRVCLSRKSLEHTNSTIIHESKTCSKSFKSKICWKKHSVSNSCLKKVKEYTWLTQKKSLTIIMSFF